MQPYSADVNQVKTQTEENASKMHLPTLLLKLWSCKGIKKVFLKPTLPSSLHNTILLREVLILSYQLHTLIRCLLSFLFSSLNSAKTWVLKFQLQITFNYLAKFAGVEIAAKNRNRAPRCWNSRLKFKSALGCVTDRSMHIFSADILVLEANSENDHVSGSLAAVNCTYLITV